MNKLIEIGTCRSPHGIKGAASFFSTHVLGSELEKGDVLTLYPNGANSTLNVQGSSFKIKKIIYGHKIMLELDGINNRNEIEKILPFEVHIEEPELEDDEYLIEDLIDFKVFKFETKEEIGFVNGYYNNGVQEILEIRGDIEIDLPFVENFFPALDLENKIIEMVVPEIIEDTEEGFE